LAKTRIFSIGHSNHELTRFLQLLQDAGVNAIADVRSQPFSQRYPQFNRPELQRSLYEHDVVYAFLGEQLGGRPNDERLYDADGRVDYEEVRRTTSFRKGLDRLAQARETYVVAMLCSEEDPLECHRGLMLTPALVEQGIYPSHVRGNGSIETAAEFEDRLLAETKVGIGILDGLFAASVTEQDRQRLLAEAYRVQARRKGFRLRSYEATSGEQHASEELQ